MDINRIYVSLHVWFVHCIFPFVARRAPTVARYPYLVMLPTATTSPLTILLANMPQQHDEPIVVPALSPIIPQQTNDPIATPTLLIELSGHNDVHVVTTTPLAELLQQDVLTEFSW
ncbi:hypothetical protein V6N12_045255 [Hibiscus sabdariffa]|uniref:Uncharacterized protein n=1 Tax=Hibiscus sabdariffa TaxID=183260 RepID=A0ABR2G2Y8_9ROSI